MKYGDPDEEAFEKLLDQEFLLFEGILLMKRGFDEFTTRDLLKKYTQEQVQRLHNHESLFLYVLDLELQRKWARQLRTIWEKRISESFPHVPFQIELLDSNIEVVVTVLNKEDVL